MAQENFFDQFDSQVQPVPVQQLQPIIGAVTPEEQARKAREEARAEEAAQRAAASEARAVAEFEGTGGKPTEAQAKTSTLLTRIQGGFQDIMSVRERNPEAQSPGLGETLAEGIFGEGIVSRGVAGADRRIVRDAQRDVLDALLTLGTGAAYNAEQLEGQTVAYFPRFGDTPEEIAAKNARLQRLIEAAKVQAGPKWAEIETAIAPFMSQVEGAPATREATAGEAFLTERDKELQDKLSQAYASGATLAELQALAQQYGQTIPLASQEELDAARAQGRGIVVTPTGMGVPDPREEMGFIESIGETLTGSERSTPEIEALPDWGTMPELNSLSVDSFQAALGTMITNPQESVAIIRAQFPGVQVRQDEKGNFILRSSADGQEYAIKPGFRMTDIPRALGGIAAFTPAGRATTAGGAAISGGLTQAGIEASQASTGGEFNAEEVLLASGGNVLGQQIGRGVNAVRSAMPARAPAQQARPRVIPDAADVIATGEREGVDVMTSNVRPPRTWLGGWLRSTGEKLPIVGTAGAVAKQADQRAAMIERLADEYAQTPASIDDVTADFIKTRGGEIAKYAQMKRDVFSQTAGAPPPVAQESIDALDMAIGRYGRQETFAGLTQKLQGWRNDLARAESINDVEAIRKSIGDTFGDQSMAASSAALKSIVDGPKGLYAALKNDMGGYIKDQAGQNAFRKWQVANGRLSDFAGDLEKTTLERVLKTGNATPEEARLLLFSNKPSDVRALFRNLSPQGKERARAVVVQKLIDDAGGSVAISELSPAKFRSALEKSMERIGVAFPRQEADRFTGMLRLLQATQNAEKAAVITPTGQSTLPFLGAGAGAAAFGDLFTGGTIAGLSMAAFRGYESKAMRNLLVALSKSKEGSRAERNILANIGRVLARTAPAAAAPTQAAPEQQPTSTIEVR